ncbi:MAG: sigma-70 factor domain-containing protein, partial [Acidimicrobiales bacterium]
MTSTKSAKDTVETTETKTRKKRAQSDLETALASVGLGADSVRLFLDDLAKHPLPSASEQVELAKR